MSSERKLAVLIDGDNIAPKYLKTILDEIADMGVATYKRIYSDWTDNIRSSWKKPILEYSIMPVQQYSYTTGKNATDSAMIIDAMDILYTGNVDGFCLVTSDSDFTRLAARLRESGKLVIGMGESKTPPAFRSACNTFKMLDLLLEDEEDSNKVVKNKKIDVTDIKEIKKSIYKIIDENADKGKDTYIGEIGSKLLNKYPDFDVRSYGCTKLSTFLEDNLSSFELVNKNGGTIVKISKDGLSKSEVLEEILKILRDHGGEINNMATINETLKKKNPLFSAKKYGYSKFANFLQSYTGILEVNGNTVRMV